MPLEARAGLHAAAGHLLVEVEAVADARRAHAVPDRGLEEERVGRHAVQRHLLQDVPEQVRPARCQIRRTLYRNEEVLREAAHGG